MFLTTFGLTVLFDITIAVEVGMVMAAFLFIRRIAETTHIQGVEEGTYDEGPVGEADARAARNLPKGVIMYNLYGAFLFGTADKLETALQRGRQEPEVFVLRMRQVLAMDATGLQALEDFAHRFRSRGKHLLLCGPHSQPLMALHRHGFIEWLGEDNVCADLDACIKRSEELIAAKQETA